MSVVTGMHIRSRFYTFLDTGSAKSPTSLCGVRTREGLIGIPGITDQPRLILVGGNFRWGWCPACSYRLLKHVEDIDWATTIEDVKRIYVLMAYYAISPARAYAKSENLPQPQAYFIE